MHYDEDGDRWVIHDAPLNQSAVIDESFEDLRQVGRDPLSARTILSVIDDLVDVALQAGHHEGADHLRRHASLLLQEIHHVPLTDADREWVRQRAAQITLAQTTRP